VVGTVTGEPVPVVVRLSAADADRLVETSTRWGQDWRAQDGRYEHTDPGRPYAAAPSYAWAWAYWLGPSWASALLFRSYLESVLAPDALGPACEVLWDLAEPGGYVVLTDWTSPSWR
jgi:hypothetical protein